MYCSNCGEKIDIDSKFCHFCGSKVANDNNAESDNTEAQTQKSSSDENAPSKSTKSDLLWDKFVEIYNAKGEEKKQFDELSSEVIWELIERLYTNAFETFIQEHKNELNTQPYRVIEGMKSLYLYAILGGYRLWIAEALLDTKQLGKFKSFDIDNFVKEWKEIDFEKAMKDISDEMGICMTTYLEHRMSNFIENSPSIKDISNESMEALRASITLQIINGYNSGEIESRFRK